MTVSKGGRRSNMISRKARAVACARVFRSGRVSGKRHLISGMTAGYSIWRNHPGDP